MKTKTKTNKRIIRNSSQIKHLVNVFSKKKIKLHRKRVKKSLAKILLIRMISLQ